MKGDEWKHSIEVFTKSQCVFFKKVTKNDYSTQQHVVWKKYQKLAEELLVLKSFIKFFLCMLNQDSCLSNLGGSISQLEDALDNIRSKPSTGPRHNAMQEVVNKLLTFDDFNKFAEMMNSIYSSSHYDNNGRVDHKYYQVL